MIRLYRNYDPNLSNCPVQMVSAFCGLNEVIQMKRGTGVITDWKQNGGTLMVGGDSRIIRVWDAHLESQIMVGFSTVSRERPSNSALFTGLGHELRQSSHSDPV